MLFLLSLLEHKCSLVLHYYICMARQVSFEIKRVPHFRISESVMVYNINTVGNSFFYSCFCRIWTLGLLQAPITCHLLHPLLASAWKETAGALPRDQILLAGDTRSLLRLAREIGSEALKDIWCREKWEFVKVCSICQQGEGKPRRRGMRRTYPKYSF